MNGKYNLSIRNSFNPGSSPMKCKCIKLNPYQIVATDILVRNQSKFSNKKPAGKFANLTILLLQIWCSSSCYLPD